MSEKTTSEYMLEIASHYLMNGCDDCPFYNVTKTCDSKPINCTWMVLRNYFKAEESKEESESAEPERKWIPVTEALPEDRDWYLGIFMESDTGYVIPVPYVCDYVGRETPITTKDFWILRDIDEPHEYHKNLKCVAWMPLPEPWRGNDES